MARSKKQHRPGRCAWASILSLVRTWFQTLLIAACCCPSTLADDPSKPSTSRAAREDAVRGIPLASLSQSAQSRIANVVRDPTMFRRMPVHLIDCDPEMHRFLIRYPEVVVNIWQIMGITQVTSDRIAPYKLSCNDGVGTLTDLELIYGDRTTHVLFAEGVYDGPLFRNKLHGRCVLVLKSGDVPVAQARTQITNRLDVFVQIDHAGVDIFAKTLHPLLGKSADVNFKESLNFLQRMSTAAEQNGPGMQQLAERLEHIDDSVRQQFKQVIESVDRRGATQSAATQAPAGVVNPLPLTASAQGLNRRAAAE